jgi:hypothetical protein
MSRSTEDTMGAENAKGSSLKQKVVHEFEELAGIFLYLAFFFCALATYSMLLLDKYDVSYFTYGFALLNALVISKVILIGEYAHLGRSHESKPVFVVTIYKAILFGLLVFAFHLVEELIKRLIHGESMASASHNIRIDDLLARSVVIFCTFIPLFGFRELRRVLGEKKFNDLMFHRAAAETELPSRS